MKRFWLLIVCCLFLGGCGKSGQSPEMKEALNFRFSLMEAGGCEFQAKVLADYGERVYEFDLTCRYDSGEGASLTVIAPEEIAGICANVSGDGTMVSFEDVQLEFGKLADGHVSPMALPWLLGRGWTGAYMETAARDGQQVLFTCLMGYDDEEVMMETWLDSGVPIQCDLTYSGIRCLTAQITDFRLIEVEG